jgi:hypothetical protein
MATKNETDPKLFAYLDPSGLRIRESGLARNNYGFTTLGRADKFSFPL